MSDGGRYGHNSGAPETALRDLLADAMDVRVARWHEGPKGATVTFDLHPDDIAKNGGVHPFKGKDGKRFKLLLWEVADDETPLPPAAPASSRPRDAAPPGSRSEQAKAAFAALPEWKQAAAKAGMLCKDERFQEWVMSQAGRPILSEPRNIELFCRNWMVDRMGVPSRSLIATDEAAYNAFIRLETDWKIHNGELPRPR